ncbi:serine hydrolase domain-containing protein [Actinomadura viridis]|uniref:D-alanyl-D-alanine carboxypeptidase n=1 Tax=Actinomadura viridis TaxID=58110 RepID=A0A931GI95_9ACTN|nr:serine hydrolase domain-containing protein [Actinomadura viridis]MBG6088338.1 D-alanyl-D-alanine carboxypeptidase [Actinomadura viridis]
MRRPALRRTAFLVAALTAAAGVTSPAQAVPHAYEVRSAGKGDAAGEALQRVLNEAVRQGAPGALAQSRTPLRVLDLSSGVADVRTMRKPRAAMRYRIGSITKIFVATVILQLVAEGRLKLGDTADEVIPGVVKGKGYRADRITMRMLLDHTSGIFNYATDQRLSDYAEKHPRHRFTLEELASAALAHPPYFRPGTSWAYSDTDYVLLGMVIKAVTGRTYAQEIRRRIIRPFRLRDTYLPGARPRIRGPHLHGYTPAEGGPPRMKDATDVNISYATASGDMISTAGDLNRFASALLRGRLLPERLLRAMLRPVPGSQPYPGSDIFRYGLGTVIARLPCGVRVYGNGGTLDGWETWAGGTRDGRRTMSFVFTSDVVDQIGLTARALEAEYCTARTQGSRAKPDGAGKPGRRPARTKARP